MMMLMHLKYRSLAAMAVLSVCCHAAHSQQSLRNNEQYRNYYTGCWESGDGADGRLVTHADGSFVWMKRGANAPAADTLRGTWRIVAVYGIPFKSTAMVLRARGMRKVKYEVGVASGPATIYLSAQRQMQKVACGAGDTGL